MTTCISSLDLSIVVGGQCPSERPISHADQLADGNGGVAPKRPDPLSHAGQLADGNGGVAPKLTPSDTLSSADLCSVTGGGLFSRANDQRIEEWNRIRQTGDAKASAEFFKRDFQGGLFGR